MNIVEAVRSQYLASLEMLRQAIVACPDSLWYSSAYHNQTWHIAYHVLFYTHLYLQPAEEEFVPWEKHREACSSLGPDGTADQEPYSQEEILAYHALCRAQVEEQVPALHPEAASGFYWLPFAKLELQFYNIRHIQQHTGELCERLWAAEEIEVPWVGMGRE